MYKRVAVKFEINFARVQSSPNKRELNRRSKVRFLYFFADIVIYTV